MAKAAPSNKPTRPEQGSVPSGVKAEDGSASASVGMTFEESITELQQIVNDLEDNSLGLHDSLLQYERGIGLLRTCHMFLEQAEQKIEILLNFKANGEPTTAPFDATPTAAASDPKTLF